MSTWRERARNREVWKTVTGEDVNLEGKSQEQRSMEDGDRRRCKLGGKGPGTEKYGRR